MPTLWNPEAQSRFIVDDSMIDTALETKYQVYVRREVQLGKATQELGGFVVFPNVKRL